MKSENHEWQVSNLELSKRLKELRVKQDSLWWWEYTWDYDGFTGSNGRYELVNKITPNDIYPIYSAFTCAELLKIRFNQVGSFTIRVDHYNMFADTLAKGIINDLEKKLIKL